MVEAASGTTFLVAITLGEVDGPLESGELLAGPFLFAPDFLLLPLTSVAVGGDNFALKAGVLSRASSNPRWRCLQARPVRGC